MELKDSSVESSSRAIKKGFVISDLHLLSSRSDASRYDDLIRSKLRDAEFFVFNGDTFDFKWSTYKSIPESILVAKEWLENIICINRSCKIHFILGNHDCLALFVSELSKLATSYGNFNFYDSHHQISDKLFIHGDLPLRGMDPFRRDYIHLRHSKGKFANIVYGLIIRLRLHSLVGLLFTKRLCARRILKSLNLSGKIDREGIREIYFGHTHASFINHVQEDIVFHNTGSAIKFSHLKIMEVTSGQRE